MRRAVFAVLMLLAAAGVAQAQSGIMLNPSGEITFDSPDHANLGTYRAGWFKPDDLSVPKVAETFDASAVTVPTAGSTTGLTFTLLTRPPFGAYVLKLKAVAPSTCVPTPELPCESAWSDSAAWTSAGNTGTNIGYTPRTIRSFLLR